MPAHQLQQTASLPRFAELGVIPGIFACSVGPWVIDRLGEERARKRGYVFRSMAESGGSHCRMAANGCWPTSATSSAPRSPG